MPNSKRSRSPRTCETAARGPPEGTVMSWFGYRNIAFIVFIVLLILYASLVPGSDAAGRAYESAAVTMLWMVVALPFFAVNAVLCQGAPGNKAAGCLSPC